LFQPDVPPNVVFEPKYFLNNAIPPFHVIPLDDPFVHKWVEYDLLILSGFDGATPKEVDDFVFKVLRAGCVAYRDPTTDQIAIVCRHCKIGCIEGGNIPKRTSEFNKSPTPLFCIFADLDALCLFHMRYSPNCAKINAGYVLNENTDLCTIFQNRDLKDEDAGHFRLYGKRLSVCGGCAERTPLLYQGQDCVGDHGRCESCFAESADCQVCKKSIAHAVYTNIGKHYSDGCFYVHQRLFLHFSRLTARLGCVHKKSSDIPRAF
jgi:hypothetical protein